MFKLYMLIWSNFVFNTYIYVNLLFVCHRVGKWKHRVPFEVKKTNFDQATQPLDLC